MRLFIALVTVALLIVVPICVGIVTTGVSIAAPARPVAAAAAAVADRGQPLALAMPVLLRAPPAAS